MINSPIILVGFDLLKWHQHERTKKQIAARCAFRWCFLFLSLSIFGRCVNRIRVPKINITHAYALCNDIGRRSGRQRHRWVNLTRKFDSFVWHFISVSFASKMHWIKHGQKISLEQRCIQKLPALEASFVLFGVYKEKVLSSTKTPWAAL